MLSYQGIARNFKFMVVQTTKQLEKTEELLRAPNPRLVEAIQSSDDYIDNQKSMIENECFKFIRRTGQDEAQLVDSVRALNVITGNLERVADLSVNIARQTRFLGDYAILKRFDFQAYFAALFEGVSLIVEAIFERDSSLALRICHAETRTDHLYRADFEKITTALQESREPGRLITVLLILHYLERMGDALLNIGEAIMFAVLGERLKIRQYRVLENAIQSTPEVEPSIDDVEMTSIWGTRSGARVGTFEDQQQEEDQSRVLFKEGNPEKLQAERESLQRWGQVAAGLVPQVVEYQRRDRGAALLLQYLDGTTLQEIVLNADPEMVNPALARVEATLVDVWSRTLRRKPVNGHYIRQLSARLEDVYRVHPSLKHNGVRIGRFAVLSFPELLDQAADFDAELEAPFSVFIHGDFNLDNIIYNKDADSLHFVDVHRSRDMDIAQDLSVFLVSAFRLPVFIPRIRQVLEAVCQRFLRFGRQFARQHDDPTFDARLALGLVRSLTTSTRFELNRRFAETMQQRASWLLRRLLAHRGRPWSTFVLPFDVFVY
jgi:phosphate uptake regulator/aminoglycoside phosphotransferase